MKKILLTFVLLFLGCSSNSNQKITSPLIGFVRNEYYIYNVCLDESLSCTNVYKKTFNYTNNIEKIDHRNKIILGKGMHLFAIDNQILVGHDIGNAVSNDVETTTSIPLSF